LERVVLLKGAPGEVDYYKMSQAAFSAKDYDKTIALAKVYMAAYPDKPQPYSFFRRSAIASDPDTSKGTGANHLMYLDSVYAGISKDKYKKEIFLNQYYILNYYIKKFVGLKNNPDFKVKSDGTKTEVVEQFLATCQKALDVTDSMLQAFPDPNDDNNKFASGAKAEIQKNIDYYSKPQPAAKKASGGGTSGKG
jgi:hypothetical protein